MLPSYKHLETVNENDGTKIQDWKLAHSIFAGKVRKEEIVLIGPDDLEAQNYPSVEHLPWQNGNFANQ